MHKKLDTLKENIKKLQSVAIAFSGGVDSTFLLKVAHDVLGDNVIAITATSSTYPKRELDEARKYAKSMGVKHIIIESEELDIEGYAKNPVNRCYYCKKELFSKLRNIAKENDINYVLDGSNLDDTGDYRPGMEAAKELGIVSPLKEAKLTKDDIRTFSREMNLPTWNKPSFACLSSRFPYGNKITSKKLKMVEDAEQFLLDLGFRQVRVRCHDTIARIEVAPEERSKFFDLSLMDKVGNKFREIGFTYVTLDILGYKTGSMNAVLKSMHN
ncbi:ATP-dependent sacrificial sulfur transferase LarE [Clostridium tyrobutyricum]|uniref:ATP-dependent sacrificial sulfur transferase LarE n=1 Tax=Clostridium tyrobutyricum TaxID=1519 RepID=UPI0018ABDBC9|nr:ATP-dependent sacrificial sulfur transferase LarE [Clostridium tyrobutyricum]MBV4416119.1 ATP-dependent sacrificial sulfur transferase LarE [Clostridium tyrobutyricum]MBV4421926.1 ATP-dependent sacrificial sulfur transferase LarE [Clostridium tyrobutyricum]